MAIANCPLCAGALIVARVIHKNKDQTWALTSAEPSRENRSQVSDLYTRVCSQCGFVLFFALDPDRLKKR
jgi:hypothetical protein